MSVHARKHLSSCDPILRRIIESVGACPLRPRPGIEPFDALAKSIAYQQLAGKAAQTIWGRVLDGFGGTLPHPEVVAGTDLRKLRRAGLSRAKAVALKDLAKHALKGTLPTRKEAASLSDEELIERCTQVRGIGPWTVEMLMIFTLGRKDVLPVSDYGVRKGFSLLYSLEDLPKPKELLAHGERWRPYRSFASWYLWRAADLAKEAAQSS